MVLTVLSPATYSIKSDKNYSGELKAHYNQFQPFIILDTTHWILYIKHMKPAIQCIGLEVFRGINVVINFKDLSILTLQLLNFDIRKVFVIPEWHCAPWFKPLFGVLKKKTNLTKLPNEPDLFIDEFGNPLGVFSYDHWLYVTINTGETFGVGTSVSFFSVDYLSEQLHSYPFWVLPSGGRL